MIIHIGLIDLHGGKLRVVGGVHALVPENAANLIHLVKAAHNQPFQIQLCFNPQEHVNVQGVVVGFKGSGSRANLQGVQDGRIHLQETPAVQEMPDGVDDAGAPDEGFPHLGVYDHVQVALAIAQVHVLQAVPLFGQRLQALGQQHNLFRLNGDFPGLGFEHLAAHAQHVTDVIGFKNLVGLHANIIPADISLDHPGAVQQVGKGCLAHHPAAGHPSGNGHGAPFHRLKVLFDGGAQGIHGIPGQKVRAFPLVHHLLQLCPADAFLF